MMSSTNIMSRLSMLSDDLSEINAAVNGPTDPAKGEDILAGRNWGDWTNDWKNWGQWNQWEKWGNWEMTG